MIVLEVSNDNYNSMLEMLECIETKISKMKSMLKGDESEEDTSEQKIHVMKSY